MSPPTQRTREYLRLFRSSPLIASGTAVAKWTPKSVDQVLYAELRGATLILFRTESHARYPKTCHRDIAAVLLVQDYRFDMAHAGKEVRVYVIPREGPAHFYIAPIRQAVEQWRTGIAKVLANPVPTVSEFRVCGSLGCGGFGRVFTAEWRGIFSRVSGEFDDPLVCLKVLPKGGLLCEKLLERAAVEREVLARMRGYRYILQLSFAFQTRENLFLGTQLCPGGDLRALLKTHHGARMAFTHQRSRISKIPSVLWLDEYTVRLVLAELIVAVESLHANGIVHGDLSLANILIGCDGNIVLAGLDMARFIGEDKREGEGFCSGPHIAPEVGSENYGTAADVWAIGVAAFELLTGRRPFSKQLRTEESCDTHKRHYTLCLPRWLDFAARAMILALLREDPAKRPTLDKVRELRFFKTVDWKAVEEGRGDVPFAQATDVVRDRTLSVEINFKETYLDPRDVSAQVLGFEYGVPGVEVKPLQIIRRLQPPGLQNLFKSFSPEDRRLLKCLPSPVKDFLSVL